MKSFIRKWLGIETPIETNDELNSLRRGLFELQLEVSEISLKVIKLQLAKESQVVHTIPPSTYKFKPTARSLNSIVQTLETRSYNAAKMIHENPAPEKIK